MVARVDLLHGGTRSHPGLSWRRARAWTEPPRYFLALKELKSMRTSRLNVAIGFLAIAPLMSALAACDEAQESTPITEVSPMGEAAVVAGTAPESGVADPAASPSEDEAAPAREDARSEEHTSELQSLMR